MRDATKLLTSELILELADLARPVVTQTSDVRARADQLLAEIDRRIPIDTYVRAPAAETPVEICASCGHSAEPHPYRHPFKPWRPGMPKPTRAKRRR